MPPSWHGMARHGSSAETAICGSTLRACVRPPSSTACIALRNVRRRWPTRVHAPRTWPVVVQEQKVDRLIEFMLKPKAMSEKDLAAAVRSHVHAWPQGVQGPTCHGRVQTAQPSPHALPSAACSLRAAATADGGRLPSPSSPHAGSAGHALGYRCLCCGDVSPCRTPSARRRRARSARMPPRRRRRRPRPRRRPARCGSRGRACFAPLLAMCWS